MISSSSPRLLLHLTFTLTLVLALSPAAHALTDEEVARRFCLEKLRQSKFDTTQCLLKPHGYSIKGKDPAVLTYLCCLGHFQDVSKNYMPYMAGDLIMYVANVDSPANLLSLGTFMARCSKLRFKATKKDFFYWRRYGRTAGVCKAPRN